CGLRPLLDPARIEDRDGPTLGGVIEPPAAPRLRLHVADIGHARAEQSVDERGLARAATADEGERGRALLEQHRPQEANLASDLVHGAVRERQEAEELFD